MLKFIAKILSNENLRQYIKFALVGTLGTLWNLALLYLFTDIFGIYYMVSACIAFIWSVIHNYLLNKKWTFKEKLQEGFVPKLISYTIICIFVLIINLTVLFVLVEYFGIWYIFAQVCAILVGFTFNFTSNRLITFRNSQSESKRMLEKKQKLVIP